MADPKGPFIRKRDGTGRVLPMTPALSTRLVGWKDPMGHPGKEDMIECKADGKPLDPPEMAEKAPKGAKAEK